MDMHQCLFLFSVLLVSVICKLLISVALCVISLHFTFVILCFQSFCSWIHIDIDNPNVKYSLNRENVNVNTAGQRTVVRCTSVIRETTNCFECFRAMTDILILKEFCLCSTAVYNTTRVHLYQLISTTIILTYSIIKIHSQWLS